MRLFPVTTQTRRQHEGLVTHRAHVDVTVSFVFLQRLLRHKLLPAMLTGEQLELAASTVVLAHVPLQVRLTRERLVTRRTRPALLMNSLNVATQLGRRREALEAMRASHTSRKLCINATGRSLVVRSTGRVHSSFRLIAQPCVGPSIGG